MVYDPDAIYQDADIEMIHATEASNEREAAEAEAQAEAKALDERTKADTLDEFTDTEESIAHAYRIGSSPGIHTPGMFRNFRSWWHNNWRHWKSTNTQTRAVMVNRTFALNQIACSYGFLPIGWVMAYLEGLVEIQVDDDDESIFIPASAVAKAPQLYLEMIQEQSKERDEFREERAARGHWE